MQLLAMAIRETSVMLVYGIFNSYNPVQFSEMEMILASVIREQSIRFSDCSPVQWVDIDMMLASVIWLHLHILKDCSPVQCVEIDMMPASVILRQPCRSNDFYNE